MNKVTNSKAFTYTEGIQWTICWCLHHMLRIVFQLLSHW